MIYICSHGSDAKLEMIQSDYIAVFFMAIFAIE
jgi:hypothetical protein